MFLILAPLADGEIKTVGIFISENLGLLCPKLIVRIDVGQGMQNRERSVAETGSALNATTGRTEVQGR